MALERSDRMHYSGMQLAMLSDDVKKTSQAERSNNNCSTSRLGRIMPA